MMLQSDVSGLPRRDPKHALEAVQLERVKGVVQRVLEQGENRMDALSNIASFLSTIATLERANMYQRDSPVQLRHRHWVAS